MAGVALSPSQFCPRPTGYAGSSWHHSLEGHSATVPWTLGGQNATVLIKINEREAVLYYHCV